jgi:hypothetical protein
VKVFFSLARNKGVGLGLLDHHCQWRLTTKPWSSWISNCLKAKTPPKGWHFDKVRVLTNVTRYPRNTQHMTSSSFHTRRAKNEFCGGS